MTSLISVIIPCLNEEKFIAKCLDSIISQDFPKEKLEVFLVDGMSLDKTRDIIKSYEQKYPFIKILDNPKKFTPFALNAGIKQSKGEVIIRMDAHAVYENNYISKCVKHLEESKADNVGGILKTTALDETTMAKAIVISLSHFFGAGGSRFRLGAKEPKEVDTVFGGCYKREVFDKIGFYNENLIRSQDMEFNLRLKKSGGKIMLFPDIVSYYYPKATLLEFFRHNVADGIWAVYPLKFVKMPFSLRHYLPLFFLLSLIGSAFLSLIVPPFYILFAFIFWTYFWANIFVSLFIAIKEKNIKLFFFLPFVFGARHFGYGIGSLGGTIELLVPNLKR